MSLVHELAEPHAIATRGLEKRFGPRRALDGLDLSVPAGAVYVLVGANGAGKSTTLAILLDLVSADGGAATVCGIDTRCAPAQVRAQLGWVSEMAELGYGWLRVGELMRYHAAFHPTWDERYAAELAASFEIDTAARCGRLSKGERRRVQLLLALAHWPPVLLLDEPMDGLDPTIRDRALAGLASHLARSSTTMLLTTHHVQEVERLADHVGVMR